MYPLLFRTVLSRMDPETAHHAAMVVIRMLGVPPFSWVTHAITKPAPALATSALGLRFPSPFGVAAGFDKDVRGARGLFALGFGTVEVGTPDRDPAGRQSASAALSGSSRIAPSVIAWDSTTMAPKPQRHALTKLRKRAQPGCDRRLLRQEAVWSTSPTPPADYVRSATRSRLSPTTSVRERVVAEHPWPARSCRPSETLRPLLEAGA
jgi:dihydroorotate dehydrogenase